MMFVDGPPNLNCSEPEPVVDTRTVQRMIAVPAESAVVLAGAAVLAGVALASKQFAPIDWSDLRDFPIGAHAL